MVELKARRVADRHLRARSSARRCRASISGFAFMPAFRGQGYGSESALAVRDHAVAVLGLKGLLAITSPVNVDSVRLLERLGFVREREMPWPGTRRTS
jgi:RimJ/RimL family protein N-acetyltransferase